MDQHEMFMGSVRHVAKLCAVAAMTAPKSGGQLFLQGGKPFIETVIVEEKSALKQLADWLRAQSDKHKEAIWYRDADTAEKLDFFLFIGLRGWYPPQYDYGACGYALARSFCKPNQPTPRLLRRNGNSTARFASFERWIWESPSVRRQRRRALTTLIRAARPDSPLLPGIRESFRQTLSSPYP